MTEPDIDGAVAVVGMAGRFPGAADVRSFWENVRNGVESVSFFSEEELEAEGVLPEVFRRPEYVPAKAVLADWDRFDADFFDVSAREAELTDPQQRILLETAWEALEDAGCAPGRIEGRAGIWAGASLSTYLLHAIGTDERLFRSLYTDEMPLIVGNGADFLATRVAYKLGLTGPATTVQTACSTSLVALHQACQALLYAECDTALAGGVSVQVPHRAGYVYREGGPMSQDGHCRAFDNAAGGAVGGSGAGVVVLKRWEDAVAAGDFVYAVVRGSAVNNDGAVKVGFTAPSVSGQASVITDALEVSGVDPESIGLVEAHGTGTALGDPIEVSALTQAWRGFTDRVGFCALGSVKTNVGHLDAAAGVAGLIKAVSAVRAGELPPSLNFSEPNERIDFASSPFYVNTRLRSWRGAGPRRAAVSSFGIGGTNAHVVLEEAPRVPGVPGPAGGSGGRRWQVVPVSARSPRALSVLCEGVAERLESGEAALRDAAFTLQSGRVEFACRRAVVADTAATAATALRTAVPHPQRVPGRRPVAFVVTDVVPGAEGAGGELRATEPAYREALDHCAAAVTAPAGANPRPGPDGRGEASGSLHHTAFATRYALARLWMSWGITPAAVLGDGVGEYVAACLAGALTVEDALALAATSPADGNGRTCGTPPAAPQIPCLANATHTWLSGPDATDPAHWTGGPRHPLHRERAQPLLEQLGDPLILEIGAETDPRHVLTALADLWSRGAEPDWKAFAATDPGRRTPLPSYPFERRSYRIATRRQSRTPENPEHGEAPSVPGDAPAPSHERPELATEYLAPRDRLEHTVTEVWERLLGFRRIGVHDDFYALGGDSLLSTRIVADLRDAFGADLPMERIIEALTPAGQAEVVRALLVERLDAMTDEEAARLLGGAGPHGTAPAGGDVTPGAH